MTPSESSIPSDDQRANQAESRQPQKTRRGVLWVLLLVLVTGSIGAGAGYKALSVQYESKVLIQIKPKLPNILTDTGRSEVMPLYDAYVNTQMGIIKSQQVAEEVKRRPELIHFTNTAEIQESVAVQRLEQTELVEITFTGDIPELAKVGADVVAGVYVHQQVRNEQSDHQYRMLLLQEHADRLKEQLEFERENLVETRHAYEKALSARWHDIEAQLHLSLSEVNAKAMQAVAAHRRGTDRGVAIATNGEQAGSSVDAPAKPEERVQALERADSLALDASKKETELEVRRLKVERLQKELDMIQERIAEFGLEKAADARVSVLSRADTPIRPSNTGARVGAAGLGAFGGVLLALVLVSVLRRSRAAAS